MLGVDNKNKKTRLETEFFQMLVCKNQENQPFLNVFQAFGNNFEEKKLGKLFGVIQVVDFSKNSEYLPNLLAQVIRKEFYRYPKENPEQCFENALHKANLALSDLARHNIIEWIDNLDAVIGLIFDNNLLVSQAGEGKVLLSRERKLIEITQSLEINEKELHPIKTFSELLTGKIQPEDKLMFTTKEIHNSLKKEELKRHIAVFNPHEFDNLVRSSLELEGDNVGLIIINASEKEIYESVPLEEKTAKEDLNFFGGGAKETKLDKIAPPAPPQEDKRPVKPENVSSGPEIKDGQADDNKDLLSYNSEVYIKEEDDIDDSSQDGAGRMKSLVVIIREKISLIQMPKKIAPRKVFDIAKVACSNCYRKTSHFVRNIDYSKPIKIPIKQEHQASVKNFFKKIRDWISIVKTRTKSKLILLNKKYRAHQENKERKKRLDRL